MSAITAAGPVIRRAGAAILLNLVTQTPRYYFETPPQLFTEGCQFTFWPAVDSASAVGEQTLLSTWDAANFQRLYIDTGGVLTLYSFFGSPQLQQTIALTYAEGQAITVRMDFVGNQLTISGATTGNGTYVGCGPWNDSAPVFSLGARSDGVNPFSGVIGTIYELDGDPMVAAGTVPFGVQSNCWNPDIAQKFRVQITPSVDSVTISNEAYVLVLSGDSAPIFFFFNSDIRCKVASVDYVIEPLTFSAGAPFWVTVDYVAGEFIVEGATAGDGTYAIPTTGPSLSDPLGVLATIFGDYPFPGTISNLFAVS